MQAARKKALLIAYHFPPVNSSGVQRAVAMRKFLPLFGVDVSVLTHSYSRSNLRSESGVLRIYDTNSQGVGKLVHYPIRILQRLSRRLGGSTSWHGVWTRGAKRRADQIFQTARPDVIVTTYPPIETLELGLYFSERYNVPLVADFRDGLMFEPVEPAMLRSTNTRSRYRNIEEKVAGRAAGILTVSEPISEYFRARYEHPSVLTIPNGFDSDERWVEPSASELDSSKFNLVYTGRLGLSEEGRHSAAFSTALTRLVKDSTEVANRLRVHFVGEFLPKEKKEFAELVERRTVLFHGMVGRPRALGFQRAATALLLIAASGKTSVATGKLFEYLNAGRPILGVTRNTAAETIILETGAGVVADPGDADAIQKTLRRLVLDPDFCNSVKPRADAVAKYSRPNQMRLLASFLQGVAETPLADLA
jgi:glycosyltransferase involved in cell wall biosynthesis